MKKMAWLLVLVVAPVGAVRGQAAAGVAGGGEASVKPGINKNFLDPDIDVDEWVKRFEVESREVFTARHEVLAACGVTAGMRVADIGAGSGLYTRLFATGAGRDGHVFAVEINPGFLAHINASAREAGLSNVTAVLCPEDSVALPPGSIDLAFVCDTYHHFEYPASVLASIRRALRKGGTLVVVEFERVPGRSSEWVLGHVRGGKEDFKSEIVAAGFRFRDEVEIEGFKENYLLRFARE